MAPDNLSAEVAIGQRFLNLGKPLIHAAVHGETLTAQVRVYANKDGQGPCPACGYGQMEWGQLARDFRFSCEGHRTGLPASASLETQPTLSLAHHCGLASVLAMNQLTKLVLGLGKPVGDTLLEYCGYTNASTLSPLQRNANCLCNHTRFAIVRAPMPMKDCSLAMLADAASCPMDPPNLTFTVDGYSWWTQGSCQCPHPTQVRRFIKPGARGNLRCPKCAQPILPQPLHTYPEVPSSVLGSDALVPLKTLAAGAARYVRIRGREKSALILAHDDGKEAR